MSKPVTKLNICPKCGDANLGDRWAHGRMLRQHCTGEDEDTGRDCDWIGEPRIPERKRVSTARRGWAQGRIEYHIYDRYGHTLTCSRAHGTAAEASAAMFRELDRGETDTDAGPYVGVLWKTGRAIKGVKYTAKDKGKPEPTKNPRKAKTEKLMKPIEWVELDTTGTRNHERLMGAQVPTGVLVQIMIGGSGPTFVPGVKLVQHEDKWYLTKE